MMVMYRSPDNQCTYLRKSLKLVTSDVDAVLTTGLIFGHLHQKYQNSVRNSLLRVTYFYYRQDHGKRSKEGLLGETILTRKLSEYMYILLVSVAYRDK